MNRAITYSGILAAFLASVAIAMFSGYHVVMAAVPVALLLWSGLTAPRLLFFLLLLTIPLSAEIQVTDSLGTDLPDELLMWLLSPLVFFILCQHSRLSQLLTDRIILLLMLAWAWTLITVITAVHPALSVKFLLAKTWYLLPFVGGAVLFLYEKDARVRAAKLLVLPMLLAVLAILVKHGMEGFSFDSANHVTKPFFRNHVNYAALLVCLVPVVYALMRIEGRRWLPVLLIFLAALVLSFSRGAWLALLTVPVVIFFVRRKAIQWLSAFLILVITLGALWLVQDNRYLQFRPQYERTIYHEEFDDHLLATYNMQDLSTMERFHRWIAAGRMWSDKKLTGFGPNSFYPTYKWYVANDFRTYVSDNPERSTVHNYLLLLMTEQGLPGMLLFVLLYVVMMMRAQKIYHTSTDPHRRGLALLIAAVLGMISVLIFLSDLIETDKIGSVFYLCAGLLVVLQLNSPPHVKGIPEPVTQQVE